MLERTIVTVLIVAACSGFGLAQTVVNVDTLGAMGDGVTWDHEAIQTALDTAGPGGTIHFTHGKTYVTCRQIDVYSDRLVIGNGATLKRCDKVSSTLTAPATTGASQVTVADASGFEEDLAIVVYSGPSNGEGEAKNIHRIVSIVGSTITFTSTLQRNYPAGSTVAVLDDMIKVSGTDSRIEGLVIDGNRRNNEGWIAWQRGTGVVTVGSDIQVRNNLFVDCWSNCLKPFSTNNLEITGNVFDSVAAAVIHLSSTDSMLFENNRMLHTNYSPDVGHSEATITWSALNQYMTVRGNCIYDSGQGAFGSINLKHNKAITIEDNDVCSTEGFFDARYQEAPSTGFEDHERMIVRDNVAVDVKRSRITNWAETIPLDNFVFEDNVIVNGYMEFSGLDGASIRDNEVVMLDWATFGDNAGVFDNQSGLLTLTKPLNTLVEANTFVGGDKGIYIMNGDEVAADNVTILGNELKDFTRAGIITARVNALTGVTYESDNSGILVQSNTAVTDLLEMPDDAGFRTAAGVAAVENCVQTNAVGAEVSGTFADSATGTPTTLYLKNTLAGDSAAVGYWSTSYVSDIQFDTNTVSTDFPPEFAAAVGSVQQDNLIDDAAMCSVPATPAIPSCTICDDSMPELDGVFLDLRLLLEGAYAGSGQMTTSPVFETSLQDSATAHPYSKPVFTGTAAEYHGTEFIVPTLPAGMIDWLVIALRTSPNPGDEVVRVAGLLMDDGSVRSLDGSPGIFLPGAEKVSHYVVAYHRNHLAVMSSSPVSFSSGSGSWDFRTGQTQAHSDSGPGMKDLGSGWFGMFGGDANADGMVTAPDFNIFLTATKSGLTGYRIEDFDFDDQVTASDFNMWLANTKAGAASQVP